MVTSDRIPPVPNLPRTPKRAIRVSDELWQQLEWVAERRRTSISEVLRQGAEREYKAELRAYRAESRARKD